MTTGPQEPTFPLCSLGRAPPHPDHTLDTAVTHSGGLGLEMEAIISWSLGK